MSLSLNKYDLDFRLRGFIHYLKTRVRKSSNMKPHNRRLTRKQKYSPFFERIQNGTLKVDIETGKVYIRRHIKLDWGEVAYHIGGRHNDRLFVRAGFQCKRFVISLPRLVWMVANKVTEFPEGHEVDHEDHNPDNNAHWNLKLIKSGINHSLNQYCNRYRDSKAKDEQSQIPNPDDDWVNT